MPSCPPIHSSHLNKISSTNYHHSRTKIPSSDPPIYCPGRWAVLLSKFNYLQVDFPVDFAESACDLFALIGTHGVSVLFVNDNDSVGDGLDDALPQITGSPDVLTFDQQHLGRGVQPGETELNMPGDAPGVLPEFNQAALAAQAMGFPLVRCWKAFLAAGNTDPELRHRVDHKRLFRNDSEPPGRQPFILKSSLRILVASINSLTSPPFQIPSWCHTNDASGPELERKQTEMPRLGSSSTCSTPRVQV
ncbi:hypothetical protein EDB85DRAFT_2149623 [Lactarius pseudohatsudake]|nr:hypothetical protein EDB85DRAFT_2149623 [Lactarius pseudohatsudake]